MSKWMKSLKRFARNKKAISGLETAIVLIAFVIVASAFAYAVLNMGFLATHKSQQVVLGGLAAASSAMVLDGPVYGYGTGASATANLTSVVFCKKTASGASTVDLNVNKTTIAFENPRGVWPNVYNTGGNALTYLVSGTTYTVSSGGAATLTWEVGTGFQLMPGQKVRVTIDLTKLTTGSTSAGQVMKNEEFYIIIKPPIGSVLEIDRVAPPAVQAVNDLS